MAPDRLPPANPVLHGATHAEVFRRTLLGVCVAAGVIHICFLALFVWAQVPLMVAINVVSVLFYIGAFVLVERGLVRAVTLAALAEVTIHAVLATMLIGWDSGFGFYMLLAIPALMVSELRPPLLRHGMAVVVALGYFALDGAYRGHAPPDALPELVLRILHDFNVFAVLVMLALLAALYNHLMHQAQATLRELATIDSLTGLRNRRSMTELIRQWEDTCATSASSLGFIMCDLDRFKSINDGYGHAAGDLVLQRVSRELAQALRAGDVIARWGGEEFLVLLPETTPAQAEQVAERLRQQVQGLEVELADGRRLAVTLTLGVSTLGIRESAERSIARADAALYQGKAEGGNRVVQAAA